MLKDELNLMKTDLKELKEDTDKQNSSKKEIEKSQRSQVVVEEVDGNEEEIISRSAAEKRSRKFRPNRWFVKWKIVKEI